MLAEKIQVFPNMLPESGALLAPVRRRIVSRTFGHTRGPITRLMSPSDLGKVLKPFVFLDHAIFEPSAPPMSMELGWHPHSGIATVTVMLDGSVRFAETTGKSGELPAGGVLVGDRVEIELEVQAVKASAVQAA